MGDSDFKYKVVMLGDIGVGKTSLVKRFVHDIFDDLYLTTIGVKVSKKNLVLNDDGSAKKCDMLLWDIGGLTDFNVMIDQYLQGASGAVVVADLTRMATVSVLVPLVAQYRSVNPDGSLVIAFNKCDLVSNDDFSALGGSLASYIRPFEARFNAGVFGTSAKTGENVESMFTCLARKISGFGRRPA